MSIKKLISLVGPFIFGFSIGYSGSSLILGTTSAHTFPILVLGITTLVIWKLARH